MDPNATMPINQSQPLETFHYFSKLPPELRLNIWEMNLPSTRFLPIRCGADMPGLLADDDSEWPPAEPPRRKQRYVTGCTTSAPVPVNLHVCSESRAHALMRYRQALGFVRTPGHMYLRPETDVLYFGPVSSPSASGSSDSYSTWMAAGAQFHTCMALAPPSDLAQVRRLAIDDALFRPGSSSSSPDDGGAYSSMMAVSLTVECLRQVRARLPGLEELIFVPRAVDSQADPARARATLALQIYTALRDLQTGYGAACYGPPSTCYNYDSLEAWRPPRITILSRPVINGTHSLVEDDPTLPEWPSSW